MKIFDLSRIANTKGSIFYGMHFYSGLAEYKEPNGSSERVYLNEDTIRSMDPTFAGRPVFVDHVEGVDSNIDNVKKEADGWVIESFFNTADGKHWVKFIVVSERGEMAIRSGMRLSNAYQPLSSKPGGLWNGITYQREITSGEYEHLAIVKCPRYDESVVMSPEEFKQYNESQIQELKKLSNSQDKENKMGFNFFKRAKVENSIDADLRIVLEKSKVEKSIAQMINEADEMEMKAKDDKKNEEEGKKPMAAMDHMVKLHDGSMCNVGELVEKHKAMMDSMGKESDLEPKSKDVDAEGDQELEKENDDAMNDELEEKKKSNALKSANDKVKADRLANARAEHEKKEREKIFNSQSEPTVLLPQDKIALGNKMWGSKKYQGK